MSDMKEKMGLFCAPDPPNVDSPTILPCTQSSPSSENPPKKGLSRPFPSATCKPAASEPRIRSSIVSTSSDLPLKTLWSVVNVTVNDMAVKHHAICTHHVVDRIHSFDLVCSSCSQTPSLGILYACRQDENIFEPGHHDGPNQTTANIDSAVAVQDEFLSNADAQILLSELRSARLSEAEIKIALAGGYTRPQLEIIKAQKQHVRRVMEEEQRQIAGRKRRSTDLSNFENTPDTAQSINSTNGSIGLKKTPSINGTDTNPKHDRMSRLLRKQPTTSACYMKYCVRCKPYFRERSFMSFGAVFANEVNQLEPLDNLRVLDAATLANIDPEVALAPSPVSPHATEYTDCLSSDSQLSTSTSCYDSGSLDNDYDLEDVALEPLQKTASLPLMPTKAESQKSSSASTGSSSSRNRRQKGLQTAKTALRYINSKLGRKTPTDRTSNTHLSHDGAEAGRPEHNDENSVKMTVEVRGADLVNDPVAKWFSTVDIATLEDTTNLDHSDEKEVHVGGGVAVTELAVTTHTPDIITQA